MGEFAAVAFCRSFAAESTSNECDVVIKHPKVSPLIGSDRAHGIREKLTTDFQILTTGVDSTDEGFDVFRRMSGFAGAAGSGKRQFCRVLSDLWSAGPPDL